MANWWIDEQGINNLRGVPGDPYNRPVLSDAWIVQFLVENPRARKDFKLLVPTMLPAEQVRLNGLVTRNPRVLEPLQINDPQVESDIFQNTLNRQGAFFDPNRRKK